MMFQYNFRRSRDFYWKISFIAVITSRIFLLFFKLTHKYFTYICHWQNCRYRHSLPYPKQKKEPCLKYWIFLLRYQYIEFVNLTQIQMIIYFDLNFIVGEERSHEFCVAVTIIIYFIYWYLPAWKKVW